MTVVQSCEDSGVTVTWGHSPVATSYQLTATGSDGDVVNCSTSVNNCTLADLHCGLLYNLSITASGDNCTSLPSNSSFRSGRDTFWRPGFYCRLSDFHQDYIKTTEPVFLTLGRRLRYKPKKSPWLFSTHLNLFHCFWMSHSLFESESSVCPLSSLSALWSHSGHRLWDPLCCPVLERLWGRRELLWLCPTPGWRRTVLRQPGSFLHLRRPGMWRSLQFLSWSLWRLLQQLV